MTDFFKKIVATSASEKAAFEDSKQGLRNQISSAVIHAAGKAPANAWRLREDRKVKGFAEV